MTRFSIIIPVYNVAPYLRECLDSVCAAAAKVKDAEIICVDDGSTDGSGTLLDELAGEMSGSGTAENMALQLKVIHQRNAGVSAARNRGLEMATGEWIWFVDADDVVRPETLAWAENAITAYPGAAAVHFDWLEFAEQGAPRWIGELGLKEHRDEKVVPRIFHDGGVGNKVYARRVIGATRFKDLVRGEDCLFRAEVMSRAASVVEIVAPCYGYRQREGSAIRSTLTVRKLADELWLLELWRLWTTDGRNYDAYRWRRLAQELTEFYAESFFRAPRELRRAVWPKWRSSLLEVRATRQFPRVNRLLLAIFGKAPWPWCAWLLFALPQKLKRMGVHR